MGFTFMDLFAGIGGFHQALSSLGGRCLFASEIDSAAAETYELNYGIKVDRDITKVNMEDIPYTDVLAAGFPCQSFSKAGKQEGFKDPTKGTLFFNIREILKNFVDRGTPIKYILLENVRNLHTHDGGNTWNVIKQELRKLGYLVNDNPAIISPIDIEIPHSRERVFIYGVHKSVTSCLGKLEINKALRSSTVSIFDNDYIETTVDEKYYLSEDKVAILEMWDDFIQGINAKPSFPVWSNYFGKKLKDYIDTPRWKYQIIQKNIDLYDENKDFIDSWLKAYRKVKVNQTNLKFEWQCLNECSTLKETIIQFRPSGVRAKRPTYIPALVAIKHTPIIYQDGRYRSLTPRECARFQNFPNSFILCDRDDQAYKQFGNSVNVEVVKLVAKHLLKNEIN